MSLALYSWNVLHMLHEIKYCYDDSHVITKYGIRNDIMNEQKRLNDIIVELELCLNSSDKVIICMQEVCGDLLDKIKNKLNCVVHNYQVPRVPKITGVLVSPYTNNSENLVVLVSNDLKNKIVAVENIQFEDNGKASLIVKFDDFTVINLHLPISINGTNALKQLCKYIEKDNCVIMTGDFNKKYNLLLNDFKEHGIIRYMKSSTTTDTYTYKRIINSDRFKFEIIDHVFVFGNMSIVKENVTDKEYSDHSLLSVLLA
ncbi:MAG: hypothetical protein Terrestrivirus3_171 [Terrestrivirus sp.]|uniref:Endonuclease/exonuclease/phosphatase family protein n=1 Tax=Terrestrivirus sp. TaxID=2487775 RepID=A0A3G4ZM13_9VIRU|nr:MAG: hypothetical protein Terrestrivirus3_171 [Terrestrivirus sp.]